MDAAETFLGLSPLEPRHIAGSATTKSNNVHPRHAATYAVTCLGMPRRSPCSRVSFRDSVLFVGKLVVGLTAACPGMLRALPRKPN